MPRHPAPPSRRSQYALQHTTILKQLPPFPTEIWEIIFKMIVDLSDSDDTLHAPIVLSHVCRSWRAIAIAYSPFWSKITLTSDIGCSAIVKECVKRASSRPIDVTMNLSRGRSHDGSNVHLNIQFLVQTSLLPIISRWKTLTIQGSRQDLLLAGFLLPANDELPLADLQTLTIINTDRQRVQPAYCDLTLSALISLSRLRRLSMVFCIPSISRHNGVHLLFQRLNHLHLCDSTYPLQQLRNTLTLCDSLESLKLEGVLVTIPLNNPLARTAIMETRAGPDESLRLNLPKIRTLIITDHATRRKHNFDTNTYEFTCAVLLNWLRCPNLSEMSYSTGPFPTSSVFENTNRLSRFLQSSKYPTLARLVIRGCTFIGHGLSIPGELFGREEKDVDKVGLLSIHELVLCSVEIGHCGLKALKEGPMNVDVLYVCGCVARARDGIIKLVRSLAHQLKEVRIGPCTQDFKDKIEAAESGVRVRIFTEEELHAQHCHAMMV